MQPTIDAIWENRTIEDYETKNSTVRNDFLRHWNHGPSGKTVSYEGMVEEGGDIMDVADPRADFENCSPRARSKPSRAGWLKRTVRYCACEWKDTQSRRLRTLYSRRSLHIH